MMDYDAPMGLEQYRQCTGCGEVVELDDWEYHDLPCDSIECPLCGFVQNVGGFSTEEMATAVASQRQFEWHSD